MCHFYLLLCLQRVQFFGFFFIANGHKLRFGSLSGRDLSGGEGATSVFIFQTVWGLGVAFLQSRGHFFNLKGRLLCPCMAENYIPKRWGEKRLVFLFPKPWRTEKGVKRATSPLKSPFIHVRVDSQADTDKPEQMCCSRMRCSLSSASVGGKKKHSLLGNHYIKYNRDHSHCPSDTTVLPCH